MATPAVLFIGSRTRAWLKSADKTWSVGHNQIQFKQTDNSLHIVLTKGEKARLTINGILVIT
jgi:hypothetical protein